ncbi:MAG: DUF6442 family protein [Lachnospiraceae bacterium]|nr:DUF6442 family protein [Lachnospiraceae bacterium]
MNKEEILKKARQEKNDEMVTQVRDQSMKWTYIAMVLTAAFFSYIRDRQGLPMMDLCATVSISVCVGQFYRYWKTRDKGCLLIAVIMLVVSIFAAVRFYMGH